MNDDNTRQSDSQIISRLTAYLDGELETDQIREIEQQISNDSRHQKLLHQLQQTWDVLDVLPSAEISAARDFTQSTMKLVVQDAKKMNRNRSWNFWTWSLRFLVLALIPCVASAGTFLTSRYIQKIPIQQLEENLDLIRNLEFYLYDKNLSVEFLERLAAKDDLFGVALKPDPSMDAEISLSNTEYLNQFDSLREIQQQRIRFNRERFQNLSKSEMDRIKTLHAKITQHVESRLLLATARSYYQWLQTLGETEKAEILDAVESKSRIAMIEDIALAKFYDAFGTGVMGIPENDKKHIYLGLLRIVIDEEKQNLMDDVLLNVRPIELLEIEDYARTYVEGVDAQTIFRNGRKLKFIYENAPEKIDQIITNDDVQRITAFLSTEARGIMDDTINWSFNFNKSEAQLLVQWMIEVFNSKFSPPDAPRSIEEVYQRLDPEERDKIDNEHPSDRQRILERKRQDLLNSF